MLLRRVVVGHERTGEEVSSEIETTTESAPERLFAIPPAAAARIRAAHAAVEMTQARANEVISAVIEGMGHSTAAREDGQVWNVAERKDGTLVAVFGPRLTSLPPE